MWLSFSFIGKGDNAIQNRLISDKEKGSKRNYIGIIQILIV